MRRIGFALLWVMVFTLPWEAMLRFPGLGTIGRAAGILAAVAGVGAMLARGQLRRPSSLFLMVAVFASWGALSYFWTLSRAASAQRLETTGQLLLLSWLVWELAETAGEQRALMQAYVLGAFVAVLDTFRNFALGLQISHQRYAADNFDPNDLGVTLALAIPFAWYLALQETRPLRRTLYLLYPPAALAAVFLTASRTALVASVIAMSVVLWTIPRLSSRMRFAVLALVVVAGYLMLASVPATSWERLATISTQLSSKSIGNRSVIWGAGAQVYSEHPLVGVGAGAFRLGVLPILGEGRAPHNTFLSVLVEQGTIGILLMALVLVGALAEVLALRPLERKLWLVLGLTWATGAMSLAWEDRKPTWFLIGLLATQAATMHARRRAAMRAASAAPAAPVYLVPMAARGPAPGRAMLEPPAGGAEC